MIRLRLSISGSGGGGMARRLTLFRSGRHNGPKGGTDGGEDPSAPRRAARGPAGRSAGRVRLRDDALRVRGAWGDERDPSATAGRGADRARGAERLARR